MYMKQTEHYRLARSTLTQHDLERSKIALASDGRPSLPYLSSCYCAPALSFSALTWGHHEKVEGHSKKNFGRLCPSTFKLLPVPLTGTVAPLNGSTNKLNFIVHNFRTQFLFCFFVIRFMIIGLYIVIPHYYNYSAEEEVTGDNRR